jgi:hypothetical protein
MSTRGHPCVASTDEQASLLAAKAPLSAHHTDLVVLGGGGEQHVLPAA